MNAKRLAFQVHKWCGLLAAAFLLVQATTGTMLVFRGEFAQIVDRAGMVRRTLGGEAPLSRVMASIRDRYPGFELQRIVYPQGPHSTYFAHLVNAQGAVRYVSVDPGDGAVLRAGSIWRFPTEAALLIHYQLMSGRIGLGVVLLTGLSLLTMATCGLIYWWPRPGRWRRSLEIDWRLPGRAVLRQAHRAAGPVLATVLCLSAVTGLALAYGLLSRPGPVRSTEPSGSPPVADTEVDHALAMARQVFPGRRLRDIRMPAPGRFNVFFWAPEHSPEAVHGVRMTLEPLRIVSVSKAEADRTLFTAVLPIHSGASFGPIGQTAILLGGLGLAGLAVTGPLMWLQARRLRSRR